MADGAAQLRVMIERLRSLPSILATAAPKVATALEAELVANIAAERGPDGVAWPPREPKQHGRNTVRSGAPMLAGAAKRLHVVAVGTVVVARLEGIEARHHFGGVRGGKKRPILPTGKIPDPVVRAIGGVLEGEFQRHMAGAR